MSEQPRLLILGATGQVGRELQRAFAGKAAIAAVDREVVDLGAPPQIRELVELVQPNIIINSAASSLVYTSASGCAIAWFWPIGRPNTTRSFA